MARCTCNQPRGHLPNCPMGSVAAATGIEVGDVKPTKSEMSRAWYPKDENGNPIPGNKLSEYEKALVISNGDEKNIVIKGRHTYAKRNKRKK